MSQREEQKLHWYSIAIDTGFGQEAAACEDDRRAPQLKHKSFDALYASKLIHTRTGWGFGSVNTQPKSYPGAVINDDANRKW